MKGLRLATLALLVPVSFVVQPPSYVSAQAAPPDAVTLWHQSFAAMKTVQYLHTVTVIKGTTSQPPSTFNLRVAGDCQMATSTPRPSAYRVRARVQGAVPVAAPPVVPQLHKTNARYIIFSSTHPRGWERSARTKNRWARLTRDDLMVEVAYPSMLCPYAAYSEFDRLPEEAPQTPVSNAGAESVHGHPAWHLVLQASGYSGGQRQPQDFRLDFFVDQQSSTWLRSIYSVAGHGVAETMTEDYSRLNQRVRIVAPTVGSTAP